MSQKKLHWIHSAGGPLVLLQTATLPLWRGAQGDDYTEAAAVRGYTGIIRKQRRDILVLADEPLETAYYEIGDHQCLVQWGYAPDEATVMSSLSTMYGRAMEPLAELAMDIVDQEQFLMDAGASGLNNGECLRLNLLPGRYTVRTFAYRPANDVELIVHDLSGGRHRWSGARGTLH